MYDNEIIEFEDNSFNHYIHHFDETNEEYSAYNDEYEYQCSDCMEEIIWE